MKGWICASSAASPYPEETQKHLDRINFIAKDAPRLVEIFLGIAKYAEKFEIKTPIDELKSLREFASKKNLETPSF